RNTRIIVRSGTNKLRLEAELKIVLATEIAGVIHITVSIRISALRTKCVDRVRHDGGWGSDDDIAEFFCTRKSRGCEIKSTAKLIGKCRRGVPSPADGKEVCGFVVSDFWNNGIPKRVHIWAVQNVSIPKVGSGKRMFRR